MPRTRRGAALVLGLVCLVAASCTTATGSAGMSPGATSPDSTVSSVLVGTATAMSSTPGPDSAASPDTAPVSPRNALHRVVIATDQPEQGSGQFGFDQTAALIELYLDSIAHRVGADVVSVTTYDDSTIAAGGWDADVCRRNAATHVGTAAEIAVIGPVNAGCSAIEIPVLNRAPLLMVSNAETYPGFLRAWMAGEPDRFYPSGRRTFASVMADQSEEGPAAAVLARQLGLGSCLVLDDGSTYGRAQANGFAATARAQGITVGPRRTWPARGSTAAVFANVPAGLDCVYLGGSYAVDGQQLIKDKLSALGDNTQVKLLAPAAWLSGRTEPAGEGEDGVYVVRPGLEPDDLAARSPVAKALLAKFHSVYGNSTTVDRAALYGVAALQVVLAALATSDGSRAGVVDRVFSGTGVSVPAATSVLGREIHIDPRTGEVSDRALTAERLEGGTLRDLGAITAP